jgi:hypothetical protein
MAKIPEQKRLTQLVLFGAQSETPYWRDLAEATRVEAISILAQLLRSLHAQHAVDGRSTDRRQPGAYLDGQL